MLNSITKLDVDTVYWIFCWLHWATVTKIWHFSSHTSWLFMGFEQCTSWSPSYHSRFSLFHPHYNSFCCCFPEWRCPQVHDHDQLLSHVVRMPYFHVVSHASLWRKRWFKLSLFPSTSIYWQIRLDIAVYLIWTTNRTAKLLKKKNEYQDLFCSSIFAYISQGSQSKVSAWIKPSNIRKRNQFTNCYWPLVYIKRLRRWHRAVKTWKIQIFRQTRKGAKDTVSR